MNCIDYHVSPTERVVTTACYDTFVLFYFNCKVFMQAYVNPTIKEPMPFQEAMSNEETIVHDAVAFLQDRVCHPYSYYYPESAGGSTTSGTTSAAASASAST